MRTITNECGIFYVSDTGVLEKFECAPKNSMIQGNSTPECASLWDLHIPEGVRVLPENAFRGYSVRHELTFPDSLQVLGRGRAARFPTAN